MRLPGKRNLDNMVVDPSPASAQFRKPSDVKLNSVVWYGPDSQPAICPYCVSNVTTLVTSKISSTTHTLAFYLLLSCCCCIPYFCSTCQNRLHHCPRCNAFLGVYYNY